MKRSDVSWSGECEYVYARLRKRHNVLDKRSLQTRLDLLLTFAPLRMKGSGPFPRLRVSCSNSSGGTSPRALWSRTAL